MKKETWKEYTERMAETYTKIPPPVEQGEKQGEKHDPGDERMHPEPEGESGEFGA